MIIGSYGFIIPDPGDESSTQWMPSQRINWQKVNDHNHDGNNSALLTGASFTKETQTLAKADWVALGDGAGTYYQDVAMPTGFLFDNTMFKFVIIGGTFDQYPFVPEITKTGASSYRIFCNDNSIDVKVYYF